MTMTRVARRRVTLVVTAVGIVALATVGLARALDVGGSAEPESEVQFAPSRGPVAPFGSDVNADVRVFAKRFPSVRNLVVRPAPEDARKLEAVFDVAVPSLEPADSLYGVWQGQLLTGALRERFLASGLPTLISVGATLVDPEGQRDPLGGGFGAVVSKQRFLSVDSRVTSRLEARLRELGFSDIDITVLPVIQEAIAVRVVHPDAVRVVNQLALDDGVLQEVFGRDPRVYEGIYFEVRDSAREPVYIAATALRAGAGVTWARPGSCIEDGRASSSFTDECKRKVLESD